MPKYVIERDLPGAGQLTAAELQAVSAKSNEVLSTMATRAQWQQSYVTDDKLFCVYVADDPEAIREHAAKGGFPVTAVHRVSSVIDPSTGEG
ncbi:MAG: hypothetical protein JWM34_2382 [Ilumatobacteraceae bacterium]|nr:hypothetical protein [Ilumatobacteraceae bacterium]